MASVVRSILRLAPRLVLLAFFVTSIRPSPGAIANRITPDTIGPVTQSYYPEVRLRKLHLVRPDLIPYPISYEVYC
jgi:hypothetical protein